MEYNLLILKIELWTIAFLWIYILYYISWPILNFVLLFNKSFFKKKVKQELADIPVISLEEKETITVTKDEVIEVKDALTDEDKIYIQELLKKIKLNISKGEFDVAKSLIVEWLTIDKFNIDLNWELASIYIIEKDYSKAEIIYKDLLLVHNDNQEILKKLGYILAISQKYELSIEIYKKAYMQDEKDLDLVNMLANLTFHIERYADTISYSKIVLKEHPRDTEILALMWDSYRFLELNNEAIEAYKKVLELHPYDETIRALVVELEQKEQDRILKEQEDAQKAELEATQLEQERLNNLVEND